MVHFCVSFNTMNPLYALLFFSSGSSHKLHRHICHSYMSRQSLCWCQRVELLAVLCCLRGSARESESTVQRLRDEGKAAERPPTTSDGSGTNSHYQRSATNSVGVRGGPAFGKGWITIVLSVCATHATSAASPMYSRQSPTAGVHASAPSSI